MFCKLCINKEFAMKRKLILLSIIPTMVFSVGCKDFKMKNDVNVIILSGQSNAVGCKAYEYLVQTVGQQKYEEYSTGYEDVKIAFNNWTCDYASPARTKTLQNYSKNGKFVKVQLGQGNVPTNFGPEIGFSEELHEKFGNKLFIIKCACGASNLMDDWADSNSDMFLNLKNFVHKKMAELKDEGYNPVLRAFLWMQGEGDSYDNYYQYYLFNTERFKNNLDKEFLKYTQNENIPFIDAGIGAGFNHSTNKNEWEYYQEVNEAKRKFASESDTNIYIDTISEGLHSDQEPEDYVHYDSESQIKLGHLFAKACEPFLK